MPDIHTPLHDLQPFEDCTTGGRLVRHMDDWWLKNAHTRVRLNFPDNEPTGAEAGDLLRITGHHGTTEIDVQRYSIEHSPPDGEKPDATKTADSDVLQATKRRAAARRKIRAWFDARDFTEVTTSHTMASPGTDPYIEPLAISRADGSTDINSHRRWLHTSPEFAMKRLLAEGFERIFQLCRVWRGSSPSDRHRTEFSMLEWYRAWQQAEPVMRDVSSIVQTVAGPRATVVEETVDGQVRRQINLRRPFERFTMQEVIHQACGFDILDTLSGQQLLETCKRLELLSERSLRRHDKKEEPRWDELFFELQVDQLDPWLAERGAVFVTDWPAPVGILAENDENNPDVVKRFELYIGGMELANGFVELTDPVEQKRRFEDDLETRRSKNLPAIPMPSAFLEVLEGGIPPSTGVALGFDRLLMIANGAHSIDQVAAPGV